MSRQLIRLLSLLAIFQIHRCTGYGYTDIPKNYNPAGDPYYVDVRPSTARTTPIASTPQHSFTDSTRAAKVSSQVPSVYDGCGQIKGCFGLPGGVCIEEKSCSALVTYALNGQHYEFELWAVNAPADSFVAVGLSDDHIMGDDSVTECTIVNGRVNAYMSHNDNSKTNVRLKDPRSGLNVTQATYKDGNLYCRFQRQKQLAIGQKMFDLSQTYHLLLARGPASDEGISYHERQKTVSARSVKLSETAAVGANKGTLVKLHGTFMVTAWMLAASCGILLARYYKLTWVGQQFMGKDLWFVYHRILLAITWALTVVAFIIIFVELGGWTSIPVTSNPHAVIGVITTVLAFIQPFMAYFRPHPEAPRRYIFNWAHWLVGKSAHTLGIVCIFLAVGLDKAAIPYWVTWLLVTYTVVHVLGHLILTVVQYCHHAPWSQKPTPGMAMRDMLPPRESYQDSASLATTKADAYGSQFRRIVLFIYILLVAVFSIAVIATIASGPWAKQT